MNFQYNPYIWVYLGTALLLILVVAYTSYKQIRDRLWTVAQLMVAFWCLGFALQISGTNLETAAFWYHAANDFIGFKVAVVWFLWALTVSGRKDRLTRGRVLMLFALPAITDILNLTNSLHGLVYSQTWMDTSGDYPVLQFICGPWYWVITGYCAVLLLTVVAVQIKASMNGQVLHRKQGLTIAGATIAIVIFIVVALLTEGSWFHYYDLTPVAIGIAGVFTCLVFRFRAQEAVPVPRNAVMQKMTSAVLVLDERSRIMDMNPAAEAFFEIKADMAAGRSFEEILRDWPELSVAGRDRSSALCEFSRNKQFYKAHFSELNDGRKALGRLLLIQDVTADKTAEAKLAAQERALTVLRERERLSRELHDSLGQVLGYTNIQIQTIREMLGKEHPLPAVDASLLRLSQVITEANTEVREFIYEVKTTLLFKGGLFAALTQYLKHYEQNFQI